MGGVRNDHIRLGQGLHHTLHGGLPHLLLDLSLNLGISFLLFVLFLDFLLGHLHVFRKLEFLISIIRKCQHHVKYGHTNPQIRHCLRHDLQSLHKRYIIEIEQYGPFIFQIAVAHIPDQQYLCYGFDQLYHGVCGKNLFEAADGIELAEFRPQRFKSRLPFHLRHIRDERDQIPQ